MMDLLLVIDILGEVDQLGLERLRTHLDLKKEGRLTDDWDQAFGYRRLESPPGQRTRIGLYREFDGSWKLDVFAGPGAEHNNLAQLRSELISGIEAAGYSASPRSKPTFGPRP